MKTRIIVLITLILLAIEFFQSREQFNRKMEPSISDPTPNFPLAKFLWKTVNSVKLQWWDSSKIEFDYN